MLDALDPYTLKRALQRVNELRHLAAVSSDIDFLRQRDGRRCRSRSTVLSRSTARSFTASAIQDRGIGRQARWGHHQRRQRRVRRAYRCGARVRGGRDSSSSDLVLLRSVIWGAMWAAGLSAQEMADFSLSWRPEDYLEIQWTRLPGFLFSSMRGSRAWRRARRSSGCLTSRRGSGPRRSFRSQSRRSSTTWISARSSTSALPARPRSLSAGWWDWNRAAAVHRVSRRPRSRLCGRRHHRSFARPSPVIADPSSDHTFGINFMLPKRFEAEDLTGWQPTGLPSCE
jgi:hypothetical protein